MTLRAQVAYALRRQFNVALDEIRSPWERQEVLLITGNASPEKIREIEKRLRFLFDHLGSEFDVKHSRSFSPSDCFRYAGVATADSSAIPAFMLDRVRLNWVVNLDYDTNPVDGYQLIDLGVAISGEPDKEILAQSRLRFTRRIEELKSLGPRPAYLIGTGPSLPKAAKRSFCDGTTVVCNTIVRDPDIWAHLNPDFLAAGDVMYHFGPTPHAQQFRADALERLRESNGRTLFVYPAQYDIIIRKEFQDVHDSLVPIPMGFHGDSAVDLTRHFGLPILALPNVLTVLLLPIGSTLSKDVRLWGFDGRSPTDSGFWQNASNQSYTTLISGIRAAHPAFFETSIPTGRDSRYFDTYFGQRLDDILTEAEASGFRFWMLHPSWGPALQKRFGEHEPP